ncbi:hypothetical protein B0H34DRAFT_682217 [Crassisporium funariophilum]|nr:hypothetical protein B0H34DRAFT_682217 [Crassisporium funariophilum]
MRGGRSHGCMLRACVLRACVRWLSCSFSALPSGPRFSFFLSFFTQQGSGIRVPYFSLLTFLMGSVSFFFSLISRSSLVSFPSLASVYPASSFPIHEHSVSHPVPSRLTSIPFYHHAPPYHTMPSPSSLSRLYCCTCLSIPLPLLCRLPPAACRLLPAGYYLPTYLLTCVA